MQRRLRERLDFFQRRIIQIKRITFIAKYYPDPSVLVGKQVCFIANFEPRKLKGVVSEGMILSAEDKDGRLVLLTPSDLVAPGCSVG